MRLLREYSETEKLYLGTWNRYDSLDHDTGMLTVQFEKRTGLEYITKGSRVRHKIWVKQGTVVLIHPHGNLEVLWDGADIPQLCRSFEIDTET